MDHKFYKYCMVPQCESSTIKTPKKLFVHVPRKEQMRKKWLQLARRDVNVASDSKMYFCEDHFDLPNDMENYMEYNVMGFVAQVRMKPNTLPSKFDCQPDRRKLTGNTLGRPYALKKQRMMIIDECLNESVDSSIASTRSVQRETSVTSSVFEMPSKNNEEKCKNYRIRKKNANLKIKKCFTLKPPLTSAERSRMYRLRKKQLTQGMNSCVNEVLCTPSTLNSRMTFEPSPQPVTTAKITVKNIALLNDHNYVRYETAAINYLIPVTSRDVAVHDIDIKVENDLSVGQGTIQTAERIDYDKENKQTSPLYVAVDEIKVEYDEAVNQDITDQENCSFIHDIKVETEDHDVEFRSTTTTDFVTNDIKVEVIQEIITPEELTNIEMMCRSTLPTDVAVNSVKVEDCGVMNQDGASESATNTDVKRENVLLGEDYSSDDDLPLVKTKCKVASSDTGVQQVTKAPDDSTRLAHNMSFQSRRQPTLKRQERRMVFDVFTYFSKENNITESQKKTAEATKKSVSTIKRIIKESKRSEFITAFRTPGKKRHRVKPVTGIDDFDKGVIKRCIHNFHKTENELPTIGKLRTKLRSDINFQGSEKSLSRIIKELGFKWKATENNRKVLIETSAIRLLRIIYLQKLSQYRQQNRPIIYTDESCVHSSHTVPKAWTDGSTKGSKKPISKGQRVVIVLAGSEAGFVSNALLLFKSEMKSGDYQDDMNYEIYQKWIRTQLLPNLPPKSVIVVDNASYHNEEFDLAPNPNSKIFDMQTWLSVKGIPFSPKMLKPQLYQLIKKNKDRFKTYSIDKIFNEHGHNVLRLPPYHPDLNPIGMAWAAIKGYVSRKNVQWNVQKVIELVKEKVENMGSSEWKNMCDKVKSIEEAYAKSDHIIDEMTEEFIIQTGNSDSSDFESDSSTDTEESDDWRLT